MRHCRTGRGLHSLSHLFAHARKLIVALWHRFAERELNFLILQHLSTNGLGMGAEVHKLASLMNSRGMLPVRVDFKKNEHKLGYRELEARHSWLSSGHLRRLVSDLVEQRRAAITAPRSRIVSLLSRGSTALAPHLVGAHPSAAHVRPADPCAPRNLAGLLMDREGGRRRRIERPATHSVFSRYRMLKDVNGHLNDCYCVIMNRDGSRAFTAAEDGLIKQWSLRDGRLIRTYRKHTKEINHLALSDDGETLASASDDETVRVWEVATGRPIAVLQAEDSRRVMRVIFSPEQKRLLSIGLDGFCRLWSVPGLRTGGLDVDHKPIATYEVRARSGTTRHRAECNVCDFHPSGNEFVVGTNDMCAWVFSTQAVRPAGAAPHAATSRVGYRGWIENTCLSERDLGIYITDSEPNLRRTLQKKPSEGLNYLMSLLDGHNGEILVTAYSHGGHRILTGSLDGTLRVWVRPDARTRANAGREYLCYGVLNMGLHSADGVGQASWSNDDRYIVAANAETVRVWDSVRMQEIVNLGHHDGAVRVLKFHPTHPRVLLTAGHDGKVALCDYTTGRVLKSWCVDKRIEDGAMSDDGSVMAVSTGQGSLVIFGTGTRARYYPNPDEQFFWSDYKAVEYLENGEVLDKASGLPTHIAEKGCLIDRLGSKYKTQPASFKDRNVDFKEMAPRRQFSDATEAEAEREEAAFARRAAEQSRKVDSRVVAAAAKLRLQQRRGEDSDSDHDGTVRLEYSNMVPLNQQYSLSQIRYPVGPSLAQTQRALAARASPARPVLRRAPAPSPSSATPARRNRGRGQRQRRVVEDSESSESEDNESEYEFESGDDDDDDDDDENDEEMEWSERDSSARYSSAPSSAFPTPQRRTQRKRKVPARFDAGADDYLAGRSNRLRQRGSPPGLTREERYKRRRKEMHGDDDDGSDSEPFESRRASRRRRRNIVRSDDEEEKYEEPRVVLPPFAPRDWLKTTTRNPDEYIPQRGDRVYYFWQGHKAFCDKYPCFRTSADPIPTKAEGGSLGTETRAVVMDIEYFSPEMRLWSDWSVFLRLRLQVEVKAPHRRMTRRRTRKIEKPKIICVDFHRSDVADYVILADRVDRGQQWKPGQRFRTFFPDEKKWYGGRVMRLSATDPAFPKSIWENALVKWDSSDETETGDANAASSSGANAASGSADSAAGDATDLKTPVLKPEPDDADGADSVESPPVRRRSSRRLKEEAAEESPEPTQPPGRTRTTRASLKKDTERAVRESLSGAPARSGKTEAKNEPETQPMEFEGDTSQWDRLNTWEMQPLDSDDRLVDATLSAEERIQAEEALTEAMENEAYGIFCEPVDLHEVDGYAAHISCPMDLSLVLARVKAGFYRQMDALGHDIELIGRNCAKFNDPNAGIVQAARALVDEVLHKLGLERRPELTESAQ